MTAQLSGDRRIRGSNAETAGGTIFRYMGGNSAVLLTDTSLLRCGTQHMALAADGGFPGGRLGSLRPPGTEAGDPLQPGLGCGS
jgi:hypothetical protein